MNKPVLEWGSAPGSEAGAPAPYATHEVVNQSGPIAEYNAFDRDPVLTGALERGSANWAHDRLFAYGAIIGSERMTLLARQANRNLPELKTFDRFGNRIDEVDFHPAYHECMALVFGHDVHSLAWKDERPGAHLARGILSYLANQGEQGVCCPMGMTFAGVPAIRSLPQLAQQWEAKILSNQYDPRPLPMHQKNGVTLGMAMTEKQAGSDLRQTLTRARPISAGTGPGSEHLLTGHKWFTSVPMSDAFLTLAQTESGVSCFFFPRLLPDGTRNRMQIQRLKDKCGNKSNASSEIELHDAWAIMLGEEGHGIRAILEMGHLCRQDFAIGSAGLMRQALTQALWHTGHRRAFDTLLTQRPLLANVLADLAIEVEGATLLALRMAQAQDESAGSDTERLLARIGTPVAKFWNCKRAPWVVVEALECHGGNGYIEEGVMARLYREAPLNSIWEGTSNMMCLDVQRVIQRETASVDALMTELRLAQSQNNRYQAFIDGLGRELKETHNSESRARRVTERIALGLQANLLIRHSTSDVADAFVSSRMADQWSGAFGTLDCEEDAMKRIIARASVA